MQFGLLSSFDCESLRKAKVETREIESEDERELVACGRLFNRSLRAELICRSRRERDGAGDHERGDVSLARRVEAGEKKKLYDACSLGSYVICIRWIKVVIRPNRSKKI